MATTVSTRPGERKVSVDKHRFAAGGQTKSLYGAAVHYWRLDRDKWPAVLDSVKSMGFTVVSTYIPWEVHEVSRGEFDFGDNKDIDAFLSLAEEKDFDIVVRPGPQINAELTWFGYPLRILANRELHALNAQGTPAVLTQVPRAIPALSYSCDKFFDEVALWYDAICPILARHAYPAGRLVAAQVDNEMAYFFHVNAYASDFHPSSVTRYRSFLEGRYGDIAALNDTYGTTFRGFEEVAPPRRFDAKVKQDVPYYLDWCAYRERYLVDALGRLAVMLRERGLDQVALFHNYPHPLGPGGAASGFTTPFNMSELEQELDWVGFDVYSRKELYHHVKTVLSYVVGTSRFPYIAELISGVWPWYLNPGDLSDEEFVTKAALMQGVKGFSRYMLVERDRWLDSPVRRDGSLRADHAAMFGRANAVAVEGDFVEMRRQADVVLLANRDYDRLEAASVLVSFPGDFLETPSGFSEYPNFMTVSERDLGFDVPIQTAKVDWFARAFSGLSESGLAYLVSDTGLPLERWSSFKAVVVSCFEFMGADVQRKIVEFATGGGTVVLGPRLPDLDERMQPDDTLRQALKQPGSELAGVGLTFAVGAGSVILVEHFSRPAEALSTALSGRPLTRFVANDKRLDVAVYAPVSGSPRRIVHVANPTAEPIDAEVALDPEVTFVRELWTGRSVGPDRVLREQMAPYTVAVYECRP